MLNEWNKVVWNNGVINEAKYYVWQFHWYFGAVVIERIC
jgi:hypothetical protein